MALDRARRLRFCSSVSTIPVGLDFSSISSLALSRPCPGLSRSRAAEQTAVDQQDSKQDEEIKDREREPPLRRRGGAFLIALAAQAPRECDHQGSRDQRGYAVG